MTIYPGDWKTHSSLVMNKYAYACVLMLLLLLFALHQILHISKVDDRTQSIFEDAFVSLGRLDNISLVMGFHPQYLEGFLRTQHYLLQMDGPLSLHYRHYIGIMVRPPRETPRSLQRHYSFTFTAFSRHFFSKATYNKYLSLTVQYVFKRSFKHS